LLANKSSEQQAEVLEGGKDSRETWGRRGFGEKGEANIFLSIAKRGAEAKPHLGTA